MGWCTCVSVKTTLLQCSGLAHSVSQQNVPTQSRCRGDRLQPRSPKLSVPKYSLVCPISDPCQHARDTTFSVHGIKLAGKRSDKSREPSRGSLVPRTATMSGKTDDTGAPATERTPEKQTKMVRRPKSRGVTPKSSNQKQRERHAEVLVTSIQLNVSFV